MIFLLAFIVASCNSTNKDGLVIEIVEKNEVVLQINFNNYINIDEVKEATLTSFFYTILKD